MSSEQQKASMFFTQVADELGKLSAELKADRQLSTRLHDWALDRFKNGACGTMEEAFAEAFSAYFANKKE